jgi:flagellar basal body-associated protein FliL
MNKEDIFILILALLLLAAMIYTFLFGGQGSKHGVSALNSANPPLIIVTKRKTLDLGQCSMLNTRLTLLHDQRAFFI